LITEIHQPIWWAAYKGEVFILATSSHPHWLPITLPSRDYASPMSPNFCYLPSTTTQQQGNYHLFSWCATDRRSSIVRVFFSSHSDLLVHTCSPVCCRNRIVPNGILQYLKRRGVFWECFCGILSNKPQPVRFVSSVVSGTNTVRTEVLCHLHVNLCGFRCKSFHLLACLLDCSHLVSAVNLNETHHTAMLFSSYDEILALTCKLFLPFLISCHLTLLFCSAKCSRLYLPSDSELPSSAGQCYEGACWDCTALPQLLRLIYVYVPRAQAHWARGLIYFFTVPTSCKYTSPHSFQ